MLRSIINRSLNRRSTGAGMGGRPATGSAMGGGVGTGAASGRRTQDEAIGRGVRSLLRRFRA